MNLPPTNDPEACRELLNMQRVLFTGAHPDDIEFYCGGLVNLLLRSGCEVTFAIATKGDKGFRGLIGHCFRALRMRHQLDAAAILGGVNVKLYDYSDKFLTESIEAFAADIRVLLADIRPDAVISWDPDFIFNPHPDHIAAALASRLATDDGIRLMHYRTGQPDIYIGLDDEAYRTKIRALRAHRTETPWFYWLLASKRLHANLTQDGARIGCKYAEVLRVNLYKR